MASINKVSSPYFATPITNYYLDLWVQNPNLIPTINDYEIFIKPEMHQRPDLLANKLYGTPNLFWLFAVRNMDIIIDPINDFKSGLQIMVWPANFIQKVVLGSSASG